MSEEIHIRQIVLYEHEDIGLELEIEDAGPWIPIDSKASWKDSIIAHLQHLWATYDEAKRTLLDSVAILEVRIGDGKPRRISVSTTEGPQFELFDQKERKVL